MTIPEFLVKLRATPGPWVLRRDAIRCGGHCPVSLLSDDPKHVDCFWASEAALRLGLAHRDTVSIVQAADGDQDSTALERLREDLLAATVERAA